MLTLLLAICSTTQAQDQFPALTRFQKPSGVSAPGEAFAPPVGGALSGDAPQVAEWTRTAGPDESVVMTGISFSRHSGTDVGKDTRFTLYSASGMQGDAQIQRLDGDRAIVTLPRSIPSWGMYLLWPGNEAGYGTPVAINKTDAWWVGPDKATRGATISVYGRNLSRGGDTTTSYVYVKSKASGAGQWASVKRVNPFKVDFVVPEAFANGEYEVWTHNGHGGDYGWSGPLNLTVYDAPKWSGVIFNVKTYGAKGDGVSDDTDPIKNAIAAAKASPGATVYYPAGTYIVNTLLDAHSNNRWQGEGRDRTFIKCGPTFTSPYAFLFGTPNVFEMNDLTMDANNNYRGKTENAIYLVASKNVWMNNVRLKCQNYLVIDLHHAKYVYLNNVEMIGKNSFLGNCSQLFFNNCAYRLTNDTDMGLYSWGGTGISMTNSFGSDYDNSNPHDGAGWGKGRFFTFMGAWGSSRNTYIGHTTTTDLTPRPYNTDQNSGEQYLFEGYLGKWKGMPLSATANTITVSGYTDNVPLKYYAVVTRGRGLGQARLITNNSGGVLTLEEPWNVIPDAASHVVVASLADRTVFYKNYLDAKSWAATSSEHTATAGVQPYGGAINMIVDNNTFHQLRQGTANWSQQSFPEWPVGVTYFTMYSNNKYIGCRFSMQNIMDVSNPVGPAILATTYRNNLVQNGVESAISNYHRNFAEPVTDAAVYEHNRIENTPIGFHSERTASISNQVLYNNSFKGTGSPYGYGKEVTSKLALRGNSFENFTTIFYFTRTTNDRNSTQTLGGVVEAPQHVVELSAPAGTDTAKGSFVLWNSGTAPLSWTAQSSASWLRLGQGSGSIAGEKALSSISLTAIARGLAQGRHRAELTITSGTVVKKYTVWLSVATTTAVPNVAPTAQLTAPVGGSSYTAPASIALAANATDGDGSIQRVEFYQGNTKLGEDLSAPYTYQWSGVAQGTYMLTAKAVDDKGAVGTSQSVQVVVNAAPVAKVAPTVSIATTQATTGQVAPASFKLVATAADTDGNVTLVEFFNGTQKIGEDNTAPYEFTWSGVAAGNYSITAKAIDNDALTATSNVLALSVGAAPQAPVVALTSPVAGTSFTAPATINMAATASDADGQVVKVEFYANGTKVGEDLTSPYSFSWTNVAQGTYAITAKAIDNNNLSITSGIASVTVGEKPNVAPVISLTAPLATADLTAPAAITIAANATDSDGTIATVEFFVNGNKIGEDLSAPYTYQWNGVAQGTYMLTAKAVDDKGAVGTSQSVQVVVNAAPVAKVAPTVSIATTQATTGQVAPASFKLVATAADTDGNVTLVEFFNGTQKIGEDNTAPYEFTWSGVAAGNYSITAKATDNDALTATSNVLALSVATAPQAPVVSLVSSAATIEVPASITLTATAADTDGSISKVEFFQGTKKLGEATTAPYTYRWNVPQAGTYEVTAKATDNSGLTATSASVTIVASKKKNAPEVSLSKTQNEKSGLSQLAESLSLVANATDADGSITKVEFFNNGIKVGESVTSPYTYDARGLKPGVHNFTAKATDNDGLSTTSPVVSVSVSKPAPIAPAVSLAANKTTAQMAEKVTLSAKATDQDGAVTKVEFFAGTTKLGEDLTAPYEWTTQFATTGVYKVTAKATDNSGLTTTSNVVNVTVTSSMVAPTVSVINPIANSVYVLPTSVPVEANASDKDGKVVKVEFFANGEKIGESNTAPFRVDWKAEVAGTYQVTAKATDNNGLTATAAAVVVTIQTSNTSNQPGHVKSYPNPFSNQATLEVAVQAKSYVVAHLMSQTGQVITTIHQGILEPGLIYKFNMNGTGLPNGSYVVAIKLNDGISFFDKLIYHKVVVAR
jgi:hypothetical protein